MALVTRPQTETLRTAPESAPITDAIAPALAAGAGGVGLFAAASLTPYPAMMAAAGVALLALAPAVALARVRAARRSEALHAAVTALHPVIGRSGRVQARGWRGRWVGHPRRVIVFYEAGVISGSPEFLPAIAEGLRLRLLSDYEVAKHNPRRCRVVMQAVTAPESQGHEAKRRTVRAVRELLGPTARVTKVEQDGSGQLTRFAVAHQAGAKLAAAGYRVRVERVISTMMPGRWRAIWDLEADRVVFEQRPHLPESVWLPPALPEDVDDLLSNYEQVQIPYAIDEDGHEIGWRPARVPHMLMTGKTGSGKTSTAHGILGKFTQYGWPVWVLDGKRVEFLPFRDWPNVQLVATTVPQQVALIHRAWVVMQERYRLMEEEGARVEQFEPLLLILDEWAEFVSELLDWYVGVKGKGDPTKPPTLREQASLARKARTARIHILQTMQRPDVALLGGQGGEARSNFGQRISIGRIDPQGAVMMWDSAAVGVSIPLGLRQRSTTTDDSGRPIEVQAYRFPSMTAAQDTEQGRLHAQLRPTTNRHPRLVIAPPRTLADLDDEAGAEAPSTFWDYAEASFHLASDRPDLDPLVADPNAGTGSPSVLAIIGLDGPTRPGTRTRIEGDGHGLSPVAEVDQFDDLSDYEPATARAPFDLSIGDLIEPDPGSGVWVTLDEEPLDDPAAPGMVALSWRGEDGTEGVLSLDADALLASRRSIYAEVT